MSTKLKSIIINRNNFAIFLIFISATNFYLKDEHPHYKELFPQNNVSMSILGNSIHKNTVYFDIVFSPDFEIDVVPPQLLSYSMKRVYKINSLDDIANFTHGLSNYHVL
ncbi:MAG: hypothetical protein LBB45_09350 [Methanobrevibacter sp.]|jgi:hypothetical protein|nr:hypothetical protein [Candidatus Methanovirga basalitermitum]